MHHQTAAPSIHEDQRLRFLVTQLDQTLPPDLGDTASIDNAARWSILVEACANDPSVSQVCTPGTQPFHENTVSYHLRVTYELDATDRTGNCLLRRLTNDILTFVEWLHVTSS